jgi:3-hydroxyacyl-[acyl-carrier-protein] dehydratase
MAFSDHLYCVLSCSTAENTLLAKLKLNAADSIYEGHFPEQPITPGVVQMAMVKELIADHLQRKLALKKINNCKFLAILNPTITPAITALIDFSQVDETISVKAVIKTEEQVYLKLKATYQLV